MSYFRAENLSLHFGGLKAVDSVSFAVEKGEILSIIGPNGAGKSSIFNLISRIYPPDLRQDLFRRPGHHRAAGLRDRRPRHRPHLPEHRTVRECDHAEQSPGRPSPALHHAALAGIAVPAERARRRKGPSPPRRAGDRIPRSRSLSRQADLGAALRRPQGDRARACAVLGAETDPARRAVIRVERRGDRATCRSGSAT